MTMAIVDGNSAVVNSLSGGQSATVRAYVKTAAGAKAADTIVKFTATDPLVVFTPESGSALTDVDGMATINVKPATVTSAGAVGITATAVIAGKTATTTGNISINAAAPLIVGDLYFVPAPTASLAAFSTASLNIPITSGTQPAMVSTGITLNSVCAGDGTATLVLGSMSNGVQTATYTNNGCTRTTDLITVSIGNSSKTISIAVDAASIGTIQFVGSDLGSNAIVLKGAGGEGRLESALLTYRVLDQNKQGLGGVDVNFSASTYTGGLTVAPVKGTTNAAGFVSTTVSSGTIPTPVRVFAQASRNGRTISGLSDTLIISTGLPIQRSMSLSVDKYNIEGWSFDGIVAKVTVRMADQYGNPIADNTAVNFITEGGSIAGSNSGGCLTLNGGCTVDLVSQEFRPLNGRVTIMAFAQGIENFVDTNGDGQYSCTAYTSPAGNPSTVYRPLIDICNDGAGEPFTDQSDPFLDTGILTPTFGLEAIGQYHAFDFLYEPAKLDRPIPFNSSTGYSAAGNGKWGLNYIWRAAEVTFSGSTPTLVRMVCTGGTCRDWVAADGDASTVKCSVKAMPFRLIDVNNNPLPAGTFVLTGTSSSSISASPDKVASTAAVGGTIHTMSIKPLATCDNSVTVNVQYPQLPTNNAYTFTFPVTP